MATNESSAAGTTSGVSGSPAPRAAAVTVLAEEPVSGLFPEKPATGAATAPSGGTGPTATVSTSSVRATSEEGRKTGAAATGEAGAEPGEPRPKAAGEAEKAAEKESEEETHTSAAPGTAATAASVAAAAPAVIGTGTAESAASTARTTASGENAATGGARRGGVLPPGRPGKPLIAAAVAGGLILAGVPLLISGLNGSDDDNPPASAVAPAGSRIGPDGSGPGIVPGRQNAPGEGSPSPSGGKSAGSPAGGSGKNGGIHEAGSSGGIHEAGTTEDSGGRPAGDGGKDVRSVPAGSGGGTPTAPGTPAAPKSSGTPAEPKSSGKPANTSAVKAPQAAPVTYSHFIGPGCNTPGFATSERWRDSNKGWRGSSGSQTSYGCSGFYYSLPLSGSTSSSDAYAQWKFPTGSVTKGSCQVMVFIPNVKDISYVGGNPAHYTVHRYFDAKPSTAIGTFEINQPSHLGQWINAGTFPVSTGKISVVLDNRGKTSGNRHAAAAPVKVKCTAS
ncbi:hypothetical protein [Streptomyces nitrosporeus]|uniref:hypothetical protein n=1 Tax=Streptomyces nitrosporeus TaxID=28894 RepID=UPI00332B1BD6